MSEAVVPILEHCGVFLLGRPLGVIGDPDFQKDRLKAAFDLLHTAVEPTIENYPKCYAGHSNSWDGMSTEF